MKIDENEAKENINENMQKSEPLEDRNKESYEKKSYAIIDKESNKKTSINIDSLYKPPNKVEALIPLPPKPKYSYLRKWLLKK